jgi:magnesium-transporting ATPase (P-type)
LGKEFLKNPYLLLAITSSLVLHLLIIYIPIFQQIFDTVGLGLFDWIFIILVGSLLIIVDEFRTFLAKKVPRLKNLAGYW